MDRRANHGIFSKPRLLDVSMDLDSLAAETYRHLEQAHESYWLDQPTRFLHSIASAGEKVVRIGKLARDLSGAIEAAPEVAPNQLEVWTRPDGAVVNGGIPAA